MKNRPLCSVCLFFCLLVCIGTVCGGKKLVRELQPSAAEQNLRGKETVYVSGRVYQKADKEKYQVIYLKNNSITYQQQPLRESKLIIYDEKKKNVRIGDTLMICGEAGFFESACNPGNFDSKQYYRKQDIHVKIWAEDIQKQNDAPYTCYENMKNTLYQFKQAWKEHLCKVLGDEDGNLLAAMLLGEKEQLDEEIRGLYQVNGIGHILAISGLHLSFIGVGMYKLLRRLTGSYLAGGAFGVLFLTLYLLMIGCTVSAVRAFVMFLFRVGADMAGRHYDAPTALSAAAAVVFAWRPLSLYDGGFWMSFGAVLAILAVVPAVQEEICTCILHSNGRKMKIIAQKDIPLHASRSTNVSYNDLVGVTGSRKGETQSSPRQNREDGFLYEQVMGVWGYVWRVILQGLTASIGINLAIFPILLYYFFEFPLYSFILNLFIIPLMSVLLLLGMVGSLSALWFQPLSAALLCICSKILGIYKMSCEIALCLPGARIVTGRPDIWQIAVYYAILLLGLILLRCIILPGKEQRKQGERERINRRKNRSGWIRRIVFFMWAGGIVLLTTRFGETGKLTTVVLDVGQGDGIFMKGPKGKTYLFDGGSSDVKRVGRYRLEPFLKSQGVGELDYVLISHGDGDHMNGVEELIERQDVGVKIRTLVLPAQEAWDEALTSLARKAEKYGICVAVIEPGQSMKEGGMDIMCIQPGGRDTKGDAGLEPGNAASMVLAVRYGEFDMLLTGDVEGEGEEQLTGRLEKQYPDRTWEILKVAHHGSRNSSTEKFLRQVQPAYALISAGKGNRYGHPHKETVERLTDTGSIVYSTQENGAIIAEVEDGEILRLEKWKR